MTCTSVAPIPCITSIVKRCVSSAPRAASTTAAAAAALSSSTSPNASHWSSRIERSSGETLSRWATICAAGAIARTRRSIGREVRAGPACRNSPAPAPASSALCAAGPSQRSSVRRISLSGTASTEVTPGADLERRRPARRGSAPPFGHLERVARLRSHRSSDPAVLASASPVAAMIMIEKLMIAITHGVGPRKRRLAEQAAVGGRREQPVRHHRAPRRRVARAFRSDRPRRHSPAGSVCAPGVALIRPTSWVATTTVVPSRLSAVNRCSRRFGHFGVDIAGRLVGDQQLRAG